MLCSEIIAVCSEIHTRHINTLCGQNVEFVSVKPGGIYNYHALMYCSITVSRVHNLVTRCRYMLKFSPRYPLDTNLCGSAPQPVYRPCVEYKADGA